MIDWETAHQPKKCLVYTCTCVSPYTILNLAIASKNVPVGPKRVHVF